MFNKGLRSATVLRWSRLMMLNKNGISGNGVKCGRWSWCSPMARFNGWVSEDIAQNNEGGYLPLMEISRHTISIWEIGSQFVEIKRWLYWHNSFFLGSSLGISASCAFWHRRSPHPLLVRHFTWAFFKARLPFSVLWINIKFKLNSTARSMIHWVMNFKLKVGVTLVAKISNITCHDFSILHFSSGKD